MNSSHEPRLDVDVLIAGGGIAGSTAALAFCRAGLTTALLDDRAPTPPGEPYRQRVSSINRTSEAYLHSLGAWRAI
ncbi:MAG: FAD-dependent oxidoreductase, partial [Proteobacteria bacterium]